MKKLKSISKYSFSNFVISFLIKIDKEYNINYADEIAYFNLLSERSEDIHARFDDVKVIILDLQWNYPK